MTTAPTSSEAKPKVNQAEIAALVIEASNPDTAPERLTALARLHPKAALAVAGNPATPASTLRTLARPTGTRLRGVIAGNPNADLETLRLCVPASPARFLANPALPFLLISHPGLLRELPYQAFRAIVLHPRTPPALLRSLFESPTNHLEERRGGLLLARPDLGRDLVDQIAPWVLHATPAHMRAHVANTPTSDADGLETIIRHSMRRSRLEGNWAARRALARTRALPTTLLEAIVPVADDDLLEAIASNPETPPHLLRRIAENQQPQVALALHRNPRLPGELRDRVARHAEDMRRLLAGEPTLSDLNELARHRCLAIRQAVARHPDCPTLVLDLFAAGRVVSLQELAAVHPNTSEAAMMRLLDNGRSHTLRLLATRPSLPTEVARRLLKTRFNFAPGTPGYTAEVPKRHSRHIPSAQPRPLIDSPVVLRPDFPAERFLELMRFIDLQLLGDYAKLEHADTRVLARIAADRNEPWLLEIVAGNPNTPGRVLQDLAHHRTVGARRKAAANPSLPEPAMRALLRDPELGHLAALHPSLTLEERRAFAPLIADFGDAIRHHRQHHRLVQIARETSDWTLFELTKDPTLDPSAIELVFDCKGLPAIAHKGALTNPSAPPELLRRVAASGDPALLVMVASHPATPVDVLVTIMKMRDRRFLAATHAAACNRNLPAELWSEAEPQIVGAWLADHASCPFWPMMLTHPACPESKLLSHARSAIWQNRCMVASNANTPMEALQRLAHDGLHVVRNAARRTLSAMQVPVLPYDQVEHPLFQQGELNHVTQ